MNSKRAIAIDLGGTKIKMAIVQNDKIIAHSSIDSFNENGLRERLIHVKDEIDSLLSNENISAADISGVGISVPGIVDSINKKVLSIDKKFGDASSKVLVEDFLEGIELSVFVLTDGDGYVILPSAKDYKRIGDGDKGDRKSVV